MPEGPEIRRAADRIAKVLVDQSLDDAFFAFRRLKKHQRVLAGERVRAVDTRGKAILVRFGNGLTMYSHNQLYGRWYVTKGRNVPVTNRSLRVGLYTDRHSALLYSASDVDILDEKGLAVHPFLARIGPDIMNPELTADELINRLGSRTHRRRGLGGLLLDQGFVAGTGNYLRSEILYFAGLPHSAKPADLTKAERKRLANQMLAIARRSYRTSGITNPSRRVAELKKTGKKSRGAHRFAVFSREGQPCYACGTTIKRANVGGRRLYYCPSCQYR